MRTGMKKKEGDDKEAAAYCLLTKHTDRGNHIVNNKQNILGYRMQRNSKPHSANYGSEPGSTDSI